MENVDIKTIDAGSWILATVATTATILSNRSSSEVIIWQPAEDMPADDSYEGLIINSADSETLPSSLAGSNIYCRVMGGSGATLGVGSFETAGDANGSPAGSVADVVLAELEKARNFAQSDTSGFNLVFPPVVVGEYTVAAVRMNQATMDSSTAGLTLGFEANEIIQIAGLAFAGNTRTDSIPHRGVEVQMTNSLLKVSTSNGFSYTKGAAVVVVAKALPESG